MKYEGKNIGILGLGKSGYWSAKLAKSLNNNVFVSDSNENVNQIFIDDLKMLGIELEIGVHSNQILKSDIIIKSPGIPNDSKILRKINAERIPVISEIEFAGNLSKSKNICITGTNGKTTTVSLLTDILSTQKKVLKSGNIGIPFSKIVLENRLYEKNEIDFCILELSSFQLEHCETLKKEIESKIEANDLSDIDSELGKLTIKKGIEVGHIFELGNKYSQAMGLSVQHDNTQKVIEMGCYGIGVSRIVAAAIEQNHDADGIIFPKNISPFDCSLISINEKKSETVKNKSLEIYKNFQSRLKIL